MSVEQPWAVPVPVARSWDAYCAHIATLDNISAIRSAPIVTDVFDHVNPSYARTYISFAERHLTAAVFHKCVTAVAMWDASTGGRVEIDVYGTKISSTAAKYVALAAKLQYAFGSIPARVIEIGAGLGGFAFMMASLGCEVTVIDLAASVSALTNIFTRLGASITCVCGDDKTALYSLAPGFTVVSEHAWSECPPSIRQSYAEMVFSKAAAGWLTCNVTIETPTSLAEIAILIAPHALCEHPAVFSSDRSWAVSWKKQQ